VTAEGLYVGAITSITCNVIVCTRICSPHPPPAGPPFMINLNEKPIPARAVQSENRSCTRLFIQKFMPWALGEGFTCWGAPRSETKSSCELQGLLEDGAGKHCCEQTPLYLCLSYSQNQKQWIAIK
jgi:hypothetical protein